MFRVYHTGINVPTMFFIMLVIVTGLVGRVATEIVGRCIGSEDSWRHAWRPAPACTSTASLICTHIRLLHLASK